MYKIAISILSSLLLMSFSTAGLAHKERQGQYMKESTTTAAVKAKLLADPDIKSLKIHVETTNGKVILSGKVSNEEQKQKAEALASEVKGVQAVQNDLMVNQE